MIFLNFLKAIKSATHITQHNPYSFNLAFLLWYCSLMVKSNKKRFA